MKRSVFGTVLMACCSPVMALAGEAAPSPPAADEARSRQCQQAYGQGNLPYILEHCPEEAWALARAQCERAADTVSPRYADFCHLFYTGKAPTYGN